MQSLTLSVAILSLLTIPLTTATTAYKPTLAQLALRKVLSDASPIFGNYKNVQSTTSTWMSADHDSMPIVSMNIPGTHDADTWNYSAATQASLAEVDQLTGIPEINYQYFRCQDKSIITMLNAGIRAFDLRPAFDLTNSTLVFWHSQALQSETATMDDVLFGFYQWLDDHPTEAVFLSFQWEGSTTIHDQYNVAAQMAMYNSLTSPYARQYILQTKDTFGTLGEARGKITLLRRFDLDGLDPSYEASIPGVHFSPSQWTDNSPNITLVYNTATNGTAYIEDLYDAGGAGLPLGSSAETSIALKYNATSAHLLMATQPQYANSLFWTFASSEYDYNTPPEYPRIQALGNGTQYTPKGGVNQQLVPFLKGLKGKRVGIVMFDFFETPGDLVSTLLSL